MKQLINDNGDAGHRDLPRVRGHVRAVLIPVGYFFGWLANRLAVKR